MGAPCNGVGEAASPLAAPATAGAVTARRVIIMMLQARRMHATEARAGNGGSHGRVAMMCCANGGCHKGAHVCELSVWG